MAVYDDEKIDDDQLRDITGISPSEEKQIDEKSTQHVGNELRAKESNSATGSNSGAGQNVSFSPGQLQNAESSSESSSTSSGLYNDKQGNSATGRVKNFFWGSKRRKQVTVGSGVSGVLITGTLMGATFFGGTGFEFIHMAQLLEHSHLQSQQNASDQETGKLFRYLTRNADVGETRLTGLESRLKTKMINQMTASGLTPKFENGQYSGFTIDTTNENSPYAGLDKEGIDAKLTSEGFPNPSVNDLGEGKFNLDVGTSYSQYGARRSSLQVLVSHLNESAIPDAIRLRILAKYGFVDWHPLQVLKGEINGQINQAAKNAALKAWEAAREKFLSTGQEPVSIFDQNTKKTEKGATTSAPGTDNGAATDSSVNSTLDNIKSALGHPAVKIAGGVTTAAALLCTIKAVNDQIPQIRYAQDILPMMRMGSEAVTTGNQVMNGTDVDASELNLIANQQFNSPSGQNWSNSQTFEADGGLPTTGPDLNSGVKGVLGEGSPSWLSWINGIPGIGAFCSGLGQVIGTVVGFALTAFSGDTAGLIIGAASSFLSTPVISNITHLIAGDAVNVTGANGPDYGNMINYGTRYFGNAGAIQDGGTALSTQQAAILNNDVNQESQQSFQSKSLAYKLFNPNDFRSLISRVMDSSSSSYKQNINNVATSILHFAGSILSDPFRLISSSVSAASATPTNYTYPFPQYGFSEADMNNPIVQNPYSNANTVATILKGNLGQQYITDAQNCFNVNITQVSDSATGKMLWDVVPGYAGNVASLNFYSSSYTGQNCADPNNFQGFNSDDWLRIRMFIFDTGVMEGYACQQGDDQSCQNDGFSGGSTPTVTSYLNSSIMNQGTNSQSTNLNIYSSIGKWLHI